MIKFLLALIFFGNQAIAASPIYDFCKSQLKDKSPCEILSPKKNKNQATKQWIKNLKKGELEMKKLVQGMDEIKKENITKTNSLNELKKELDVANAQVVYRMEEVKGLKGQLDNVTVQLSQKTEENRKLKKNYEEINGKFEKFSSEYYIQNRITIVLGILFLLTLFLLIKKAKESFNARKEISVLRGKLKELSINVVETEEFPIPNPVTSENPVHPLPQ